MLQKARIKIVARAIYTCLFFSYIYSPFLLENKSLLSKLDHNYSSIIYESKYFRVDQVKFWKTAFKNFEGIWSAEADHILSIFLKAVFHKFYLVHSWILCLMYWQTILVWGLVSIWLTFHACCKMDKHTLKVKYVWPFYITVHERINKRHTQPIVYPI